MILAEFSDGSDQLASLIKQFAGNVRFHAKRPIHVRKHHKCFSLASIFFAMFQSMNMTSFQKIGARATKNEPKWYLFSGRPALVYNFAPAKQHSEFQSTSCNQFRASEYLRGLESEMGSQQRHIQVGCEALGELGELEARHLENMENLDAFSTCCPKRTKQL